MPKSAYASTGPFVNGTWRKLRVRFAGHVHELQFWMAVRQAFLAAVLGDYDADLALTLFYSTMRLALASTDIAVEYDDDGLVRRPRASPGRRIGRLYPASPDLLASSVAAILNQCGFRAPFENLERDVRPAPRECSMNGAGTAARRALNRS